MPTELGPDFWLPKELSDLRSKVDMLLTRDVLRNAAITAGGLTIKEGGSLWIEGTGAAYVNGLKLSSVSLGSVGGTTTNWAVAGTSTAVCTLTFTVPPGFGTAIVMNVCQVNVLNSAATTNFIYASAAIDGVSGAGSAVSGDAGMPVTLSPSAIRTIDTSSLATFTVAATVNATTALAANAWNSATVNAIAVFME